jgi:hypothetical protein
MTPDYSTQAGNPAFQDHNGAKGTGFGLIQPAHKGKRGLTQDRANQRRQQLSEKAAGGFDFQVVVTS